MLNAIGVSPTKKKKVNNITGVLYFLWSFPIFSGNQPSLAACISGLVHVANWEFSVEINPNHAPPTIKKYREV